MVSVSFSIPSRHRISYMLWSNIAWLTSPYLLVGIGGAVGSALRYGVGRLVAAWSGEDSPMWGTGTVNMVGSFALGCLMMALGGSPRSHPLVLLLGVGLCGGFTTFSTLSMELADLIQARRWDSAFIYGFASLVGGWLAFVAGAWCMSLLSKP